jgi:integrase
VTPRKKSAENEAYRIDKILRHQIASTRLYGLNPAMFAAYRDERLKEVGPQAVRHYLNLLHHVIKVAIVEWDLPLDSNPMERVSKPPLPRSRERRLAPEELETLEMAAGQSPHYMIPLINLAVETGMRRGEMLAMRWEHFSAETRLLHIPITKNGHPRTIPLSPRASTHNIGSVLPLACHPRTASANFRASPFSL